jgi:hypothetical protein
MPFFTPVLSWTNHVIDRYLSKRLANSYYDEDISALLRRVYTDPQAHNPSRAETKCRQCHSAEVIPPVQLCDRCKEKKRANAKDLKDRKGVANNLVDLSQKAWNNGVASQDMDAALSLQQLKSGQKPG